MNPIKCHAFHPKPYQLEGPLCFHDLAQINNLAMRRNEEGELIAYTHDDGSHMRKVEVGYLTRRNRDLLDCWYLEMAEFERKRLKPREKLPDWMLRAEMDAWKRTPREATA